MVIDKFTILLVARIFGNFEFKVRGINQNYKLETLEYQASKNEKLITRNYYNKISEQFYKIMIDISIVMYI